MALSVSLSLPLLISPSLHSQISLFLRTIPSPLACVSARVNVCIGVIEGCVCPACVRRCRCVQNRVRVRLLRTVGVCSGVCQYAGLWARTYAELGVRVCVCVCMCVCVYLSCALNLGHELEPACPQFTCLLPCYRSSWRLPLKGTGTLSQNTASRSDRRHAHTLRRHTRTHPPHSFLQSRPIFSNETHPADVAAFESGGPASRREAPEDGTHSRVPPPRVSWCVCVPTRVNSASVFGASWVYVCVRDPPSRAGLLRAAVQGCITGRAVCVLHQWVGVLLPGTCVG